MGGPGVRPPAALGTPPPGEAVREKATLEQTAQHPLDDWAQGAVAAGETLRPDAQHLFEVRLDEPIERRLTRSPRPVDPAGDLHAQPEAGGGDAGAKERWAFPARAPDKGSILCEGPAAGGPSARDRGTTHLLPRCQPKPNQAQQRP
jgi:hypothetical protein